MKQLIVTLGILFLVFNIQAQDIFEWRGQNREGIYPDKNLLKMWPDSGLQAVWEYTDCGRGYGSPVFTDNGMFLMGEKDSLGYLLAFDSSGRLMWQNNYGAEWVKSFPGSRAAPTVVGNLIYVVSGFGNLYCFDIETGGKKWHKDLKTDFDGEYTMHGHSESPAVDGDRIFLNPGGKEHNVVALNRFTGELIWSGSGLGERSGYNAPLVIVENGRKILVQFSAYALMGLDAETGQLLWTHLQDNIPVDERKPGAGDTHSNTVIYDAPYLYYAAGDGNCGVKLELINQGTAVKELWRNKDFDSFMGGIIKIGDNLYGCGTAQKDFKAVDALTGKTIDDLKIGSGVVIAADDMLYYYSQRGFMHLVKPDNGKLSEISKFKITKGEKEHFAHPVINKGRLYVRHGTVLQAFDIKG